MLDAFVVYSFFFFSFQGICLCCAVFKCDVIQRQAAWHLVPCQRLKQATATQGENLKSWLPSKLLCASGCNLLLITEDGLNWICLWWCKAFIFLYATKPQIFYGCCFIPLSEGNLRMPSRLPPFDWSCAQLHLACPFSLRKKASSACVEFALSECNLRPSSDRGIRWAGVKRI